MKDESGIVINNVHINKNYYLIQIRAPYISENCKPGNFIMLTVSKSYDPLLKRPFGIYQAKPPSIWLYYEIVGRGTEAMSTLKTEDKLRILGPLGNSFPQFKQKKILVIAGGRGIAPLFFAMKSYDSNNDLYLVYGAQTKGDLNLLGELKVLSLKKIFLYTEDGSFGKKGLVTADIKQVILGEKIDVAISCGPDSMFKSISDEIAGIQIKNYVSLEALMGCGFGICYSCAVKTKDDEYKKVCSQGPIFEMEEIEW